MTKTYYNDENNFIFFLIPVEFWETIASKFSCIKLEWKTNSYLKIWKIKYLLCFEDELL